MQTRNNQIAIMGQEQSTNQRKWISRFFVANWTRNTLRVLDEKEPVSFASRRGWRHRNRFQGTSVIRQNSTSGVRAQPPPCALYSKPAVIARPVCRSVSLHPRSWWAMKQTLSIEGNCPWLLRERERERSECEFSESATETEQDFKNRCVLVRF